MKISISGFTLFGAAFFAAFGEHLTNMETYFWVVGILVILDTVTGIGYHVLHKGEELESNKWRGVLNKVIQYSAALILSLVLVQFVAESSGTEPMYRIVIGVAGLIITAEVISVIENITGSTGIDLGFLKGFLPTKEK